MISAPCSTVWVPACVRRGHRRAGVALGGPGHWRGQGSAGAAAQWAGWPRSGTCSSLRPRWPKLSPRFTAKSCPRRRSIAGPGPPSMLTRRYSPRWPTASGRRARSANRSSGASTGSTPIPGTGGWTRCRRPASAPSSHQPRSKRCSPAPGRHRRRGRQLHDGLRYGRRHGHPTWCRLTCTPHPAAGTQRLLTDEAVFRRQGVGVCDR